MAYQKLQVSGALAVLPSDDIDIPNPSSAGQSGTAAGPTGAQLVGTGTSFTTTVSIGDIIYAGAGALGTPRTIVATVEAVVSDTVLTTSTAITSTFTYTIYSQIDSPSGGCVLYCGATGDIEVTTAGGDTVEFTGVPTGAFMPVQVTRVHASNTTATNIIALF